MSLPTAKAKLLDGKKCLISAPIFMPLDVSAPHQLEAVFARIGEAWGKLNHVIHSAGALPARQTLTLPDGAIIACCAEFVRCDLDLKLALL